jgi:hypothetical protein
MGFSFERKRSSESLADYSRAQISPESSHVLEAILFSLFREKADLIPC